jgi:hypothetical protein
MTIHFLPPELDRYDAAVEDAIATCDGDIMGALKALLIVNEHLEAQLVELRAVMATGGYLGMPNRPVAALVHLGHASRHEAPVEICSSNRIGQTIVRPARLGSVITASSGTSTHLLSRRTR